MLRQCKAVKILLGGQDPAVAWLNEDAPFPILKLITLIGDKIPIREYMLLADDPEIVVCERIEDKEVLALKRSTHNHCMCFLKNCIEGDILEVSTTGGNSFIFKYAGLRHWTIDASDVTIHQILDNGCICTNRIGKMSTYPTKRVRALCDTDAVLEIDFADKEHKEEFKNFKLGTDWVPLS